MKKLQMIGFLLCIGFTVSGFDTSGMKLIYQNDLFTFYSEDEKDYSLFIRYINNENKRLEKVFNRKLEHNIFYIYSDHKSVSSKVFNADENSPYCGFADIINKTIYITSPYDSYKYKTFIDYFNTPVHELVHQYYSPSVVWLREGIAHYFSNLYLSKKITRMPKSIMDFKFYAYTPEDTFQAYIMSGWLVKYIFEERCNKDMKKFLTYANHSKNYKIINYSNEKELFSDFNQYMILKNIEQKVIFNFSKNGLVLDQHILRRES